MPDGPVPLTAGWIGRPLRRREDARLLAGQGRFTADLPPPPACLHAAFARADAVGRVAAADRAAALAVPGVVAVLLPEDLGPLGQPAVNAFFPGLPAARFEPLSASPPCVGHPVALVLAESPAAALDGAEALGVAVEPGDAAAGETAWTSAWGDAGATEAAFARAAHVVRARIAHARLAPSALEPRAALAEPAGEGLTLHLSSQTPHRARSDLALVLGMAPEAIRVVAPDVGGAFGAKASLAPEEAAIALAARRLGRPVRWVATRTEEMLAATQGRGGVLEGELALDGSGRALALRARIVVPLGHRLPYSATVPGRNAARILPGPYDIAAIHVSLEGRFDRRAAIGIYRGAGRPEAAMLMERLMEAAASETGLDPAAIRRRNLLPPAALPHPTPTGETLDSGDYPALLDAALEAAGGAWPVLAAARDARRAAGARVGIGLALYVEPCGQGWESARLAIHPDGRVVAATGSTAQGQGRETAAAQIVAEALRLASPDRVEVRHGDTASVPPGIGALASRSTGIGGGALLKAAALLEAEALPRAARLLNCAVDFLRPAPGGFARADDPARRVAWAALAAEAPLAVETRFEAAGESWAAGCCLARVALDPETGVAQVEHLAWADDIGTVVNPVLVRGQMWGGLAQGLGEALMERVAYDVDGQLLSGSFMDYALPRATDLPGEVGFAHPPEPARALNTPLGAKGVGEAGCIGVPAALANAVADAVGDGMADLALPLTQERIWRALHGLPQEEGP